MSLQGKGVMLSGDRAVGKRPLPIATSQGWFALYSLCKVTSASIWVPVTMSRFSDGFSSIKHLDLCHSSISFRFEGRPSHVH